MCAHATTFKKYFSRKPALNALLLLNNCNVIPVFKKAKSLIIEPTVLLDLNFTYARAQKATARNIHGNAPEYLARAPE